MRHLIPALVVTAALVSSAHAQPAKPSPFSNKSYGDGGGYKHPDAAVGQFFETKPKAEPEAKPGPRTETPAPAKTSPDIRPSPAPARASRPRPRPFAPVAAKSAAPIETVSAASLEAPPAAAPAPKLPAVPSASAAGEGALDAESEDARRDYEARLFGAAPEPRRPRLEDPKTAPLAEMTDASANEGMLFVSLELDAQEAGSLRDAVAGLGAAAAFRADARFQPLPGAGGSVRISGWLPASRLGDAIARPGVKRVEVERGSRPAPDARVTGDYLLTLRVSDASRPEESIAEGVRDLSFKTGFKLDRVLGVETSPAGGSTALVSGTLPVSQLARALGLSGVIKVAPALPVEKPAAEAPAAPAKKEGFLQFVMARSLWLVLLTVLLALPTVGGVLRKGLSVFVPYR